MKNYCFGLALSSEPQISRRSLHTERQRNALKCEQHGCFYHLTNQMITWISGFAVIVS